jgi:hypothetical protein
MKEWKIAIYIYVQAESSEKALKEAELVAYHDLNGYKAHPVGDPEEIKK